MSPKINGSPSAFTSSAPFNARLPRPPTPPILFHALRCKHTTRASPHCHSHSRNFSSSIKMSSSLNNSVDPVERTSSPYPDPRQIGPKSKLLATRTSNFHSTSLRNMVTVNTVNKTALHPGGVQYVDPTPSTSSASPPN